MKPKMRKRARRYAVQAIYQWQMSDNGKVAIKNQFLEDNDMKNVDVDYFEKLLYGVVDGVDAIDAQFVDLLDRGINELDPVERAVLRMATFELLNCIDVPYKVVINEALDQAKQFGSVEGYKYVNAVLDKIAQKIRHTEING